MPDVQAGSLKRAADLVYNPQVLLAELARTGARMSEIKARLGSVSPVTASKTMETVCVRGRALALASFQRNPNAGNAYDHQ